MSRQTVINLCFAIVLVAIPAKVHDSFQGLYTSSRLGTLSIGPIENTLPFGFLVLSSLSHCYDIKRKKPAFAERQFPKAAYCGAALAWFAMMGVTWFIISQNPGPARIAAVGRAILAAVTPAGYFPFRRSCMFWKRLPARSGANAAMGRCDGPNSPPATLLPAWSAYSLPPSVRFTWVNRSGCFACSRPPSRPPALERSSSER